MEHKKSEQHKHDQSGKGSCSTGSMKTTGSCGSEDKKSEKTGSCGSGDKSKKGSCG